MRGLYYERRLIAGVGGTSFARAGFVHLEITTAEAEVVQRFDSGLNAFASHLHKTKTAGAAGFTIRNELHGSHFAVRGKKIANIIFGSGPGEIADKRDLVIKKETLCKKRKT